MVSSQTSSPVAALMMRRRDLADRGAHAVVFACTEIGLHVRPEDAPLPSIDSAVAHADLLVELALAVTTSAEPDHRLSRQARGR